MNLILPAQRLLMGLRIRRNSFASGRAITMIIYLDISLAVPGIPTKAKKKGSDH